MNLEKRFANPPVQYRGKPFWAWNGKLDEQELRRQVRILRKMGLAGGFMHSRVGLDTEYLSDEWFRMVNACIDEAKKTGGEMCQPWTRGKTANPESIPVELVYKFDCDFIPGGLIELAIESPERYTIFINEHELDIDSKSGWWVDKSIRKIPVNPCLLNKGKNEILLKVDYTENDGLESIFLLGSFGVSLEDGIRPVIKRAVKVSALK